MYWLLPTLPQGHRKVSERGYKIMDAGGNAQRRPPVFAHVTGLALRWIEATKMRRSHFVGSQFALSTELSNDFRVVFDFHKGFVSISDNPF